jgi:hypothetical protein
VPYVAKNQRDDKMPKTFDNGIKISFDLDGTICDADWGYLDNLRDKGWPKDEEEKYYSCREKILDPYRFVGPDDTLIILTGRPAHLKEVTLKWLKKNGLGHVPVVFTKTLPKHPNATLDEFTKIGFDKALYCYQNGVAVHFDDNEQVVKSMRYCLKDRNDAVTVIHAGWHTSW